MKCVHGWIELGTDLEMYYMNRNNFFRCLQCRYVGMIKYQSSLGKAIKSE